MYCELLLSDRIERGIIKRRPLIKGASTGQHYIFALVKVNSLGLYAYWASHPSAAECHCHLLTDWPPAETYICYVVWRRRDQAHIGMGPTPMFRMAAIRTFHASAE